MKTPFDLDCTGWLEKKVYTFCLCYNSPMTDLILTIFQPHIPKMTSNISAKNYWNRLEAKSAGSAERRLPLKTSLRKRKNENRTENKVRVNEIAWNFNQKYPSVVLMLP
jgi:hypothetical protein